MRTVQVGQPLSAEVTHIDTTPFEASDNFLITNHERARLHRAGGRTRIAGPASCPHVRQRVQVKGDTTVSARATSSPLVRCLELSTAACAAACSCLPACPPVTPTHCRFAASSFLRPANTGLRRRRPVWYCICGRKRRAWRCVTRTRWSAQLYLPRRSPTRTSREVYRRRFPMKFSFVFTKGALATLSTPSVGLKQGSNCVKGVSPAVYVFDPSRALF